MYTIHLYGKYYKYNGEDRFVDETPFDVPKFDLHDKKLIERIVKSRYPDCKECDSVQVSLDAEYDTVERKLIQEREAREARKAAKTTESVSASSSSSSSSSGNWIWKVLWWLIKAPFRLFF